MSEQWEYHGTFEPASYSVRSKSDPEVERLRVLLRRLAEYGEWNTFQDGGDACAFCDATPFSINGCSGPNTGNDPHDDDCPWPEVLAEASKENP